MPDRKRAVSGHFDPVLGPDDPTPKIGSSADRAVKFAQLAGAWADACHATELRCSKVLAVLDIQRAREAAALKRKFEGLALRFRLWTMEGGAPAEQKMADARELDLLQKAAAELGVRLSDDVQRSV